MAEFILKDQYGKEKTFDHDKIFVMGTDGELVQFTQGEGASSDLCYVTFMSYDGLTEYGKKAVAVGDDCADPIARGIFATPTRESDVQYNYTFYGWATTPNGSADSNWNKAVTEEKTVYANFASAVRYYTITYYDSDGTTVLKTESLAYGAMPNYSPTKSGVSFGGWTPSVVAVTGNASYTAVWVEKITFANGSWEDIARISESGEASSYFAVGDSKVITVGSKSITLRLIGFNHDTLANGSGKAGITIFAEKTLDTTISIPNWSTVATTMKNSIKSQLPSELQAVIKPVLKSCDDGTLTNQEITPTDVEFELFPLSFEEVGIKRHGGRKSTDSTWKNYVTPLGKVYTYYSSKYNSTYGGPYVAPFYTDGDIYQSWFRQHFRESKNYATIHDVNLVSSGPTWFSIVKTTEQHKVMFAFCI